MKQQVLVTGGAGFIGSHVVEQLVERGMHVRVLDNLRSGLLENLDAVADKIEFVEGDIRDYSSCVAATRGCTTVYHLAAMVSVPESMENPQECFDINVTGTQNLLEACRANGINKFIFSSSSAVYGPVDGVCSEDMTPHPISYYGTSKLIGEQLCHAYKQLGVNTLALRYFNVFGDRQRADSPYSGVIAQFNKHMRANKPITIYGDGLQTRDFVPVEAVAHANIQLSLLPDSELNGQPINVASGKSISLLELFEQLKKTYEDYTHRPCLMPARAGDIRYSQADIKLLSQLESIASLAGSVLP